MEKRYSHIAVINQAVEIDTFTLDLYKAKRLIVQSSELTWICEMYIILGGSVSSHKNALGLNKFVGWLNEIYF